jgi:hypothetical protein
MSRTPLTTGSTRWDDLVDRLRAYDVRYLTGGAASPQIARDQNGVATIRRDADVRALILDLAHAPEARLRDALVALLFRHSEYAPIAVAMADALPAADPAHLVLHVSVLAAASLQRAWSFTLDIYVPGWRRIDGAIAAQLGVPSPDEDYGRPCLHAVSRLLASGQPFPYDYARGWQDVAELVLEDMRVEARLSSRP